MSVGILTALKTFKEHPYVQYVGIGLAGLANTLAADSGNERVRIAPEAEVEAAVDSTQYGGVRD